VCFVTTPSTVAHCSAAASTVRPGVSLKLAVAAHRTPFSRIPMFGSRDGFRAVDMKIKDRPFRYSQVANSSRQLEPLRIPSLYFER
jgi:hypothetical protein